MKLVTLVSGGLDSTLMSILAKEQGFELYPLFLDYGQLAAKLEWESCVYNHKMHNLPRPKKLKIPGFGKFIRSGITIRTLRVKEDAFLPARNALFLLTAVSYAYRILSKNVSIGLLSDEYKLFPDQSQEFINNSNKYFSSALGYKIKILTPLMGLNKAEVIRLSKAKKINYSYSCHAGNVKPCGKCISCLEFKMAYNHLK